MAQEYFGPKYFSASLGLGTNRLLHLGLCLVLLVYFINTLQTINSVTLINKMMPNALLGI